MPNTDCFDLPCNLIAPSGRFGFVVTWWHPLGWAIGH